MNDIIAAIIGGCFTIAGVLLGHYLRTRSDPQSLDIPGDHEALPEKAEPQAFATPQQMEAFTNVEAEMPTSSDVVRRVGQFCIALAVVLILVVVNVFDLNNKEPAWESIFTAVVFSLLGIGGFLWALNRKRVG